MLEVIADTKEGEVASGESEYSSLEACPRAGLLGRGEQAVLLLPSPLPSSNPLLWNQATLCCRDQHQLPLSLHENFQTFAVVHLFLVVHKPDCTNSE